MNPPIGLLLNPTSSTTILRSQNTHKEKHDLPRKIAVTAQDKNKNFDDIIQLSSSFSTRDFLWLSEDSRQRWGNRGGFNIKVMKGEK